MISAKVKSFYPQFVQAFRDRNLAQANQLTDDFIAPNCIWHDPSSPEPYIGPEGQKKFNQALLEANTDIQTIINDLVEAGDKMIIRGTMQFKEIASGNEIHLCMIEIDRIAGDQIIESWSVSTPGSW
jgi:hypothetical protein